MFTILNDKITLPALRSLRSRVVSAVIVESHKNYFDRIFPRIVDMAEELTDFRDGMLRKAPGIMFKPVRKIARFNMASIVAPREVIFELAQDRNVARIYNDNMIYALYNTIPEASVYNITAFTKTKRVTTTEHTKKLLGLTNSEINGLGSSVAVLDTGVSRHPNQPMNIIDYESTTQQIRDDNGHGTWCGTCIGGNEALVNNIYKQTGKHAKCIGMAPRSSILSIKCLGWHVGTGSTSGILEAVESAVKNKVDIISMSLGGESEAKIPEDDPFYNVFKSIKQNENIIPVIAAGNSGPNSNTIGSPGCFDEVLTVGAYDQIDGNMAEFSSRGPTNWNTIKPDCVAPGVEIVSGSNTVCDRSDGRQDGFAPLSGTSMATPHVAGLVACMVQNHRKMGAELYLDEIIEMLKTLGHEKNNDDGYGPIDWFMYRDWVKTKYGYDI